MNTFKTIAAICAIITAAALPFSASAEITHRTGDVILGSATMTEQEHNVTISSNIPCSKKAIHVVAETTGGTTLHGHATATYVMNGGASKLAAPTSANLTIYPKNSGFDNDPITFTRDEQMSGDATWTVSITVSSSIPAATKINFEVYYNTAEE
jgi:hypothetical protein